MINEKTYVEIRGRKTFLLEGLERITEYGDTRIAVSCGEYSVAVNGEGMTLAFLADNRISVEGRIDSVEYIEKHRSQSRWPLPRIPVPEDLPRGHDTPYESFPYEGRALLAYACHRKRRTPEDKSFRL